MRRKVKLYIGLLLGLPLLLFALVGLALQFSGPQNWATQLVVNSLSEKINTKISLERIDIDFIKTLSLEGFYIEDQQKDTLLYAENLKATIGLFSLIGKKIELSDIGLEGIVANVARNDKGAFNFDFIIDAFADTTAIVDTTAESWGFSIGQINLQESEVNFNDLFADQKIKANIGSLELDIDEMDLKQLKFDLAQIDMENSTVSYEAPARGQNIQADIGTIAILDGAVEINEMAFTIEEIVLVGSKVRYQQRSEAVSDLQMTADPTIPFPELPISLTLNNLQLKDNEVIYERATEGRSSINRHVVRQKDWSLNNLSLQKNSISTSLELGDTKYNDFPLVNELNAKIKFLPERLQLANLKLVTGNTLIENAIEIKYASLDELVRELKFQKLDATFARNKIASNDIIAFGSSFLNKEQLQKLPRDNFVNLTGRIAGDSQRLNIDKLILDLGEKNNLQLSGKVSNYLRSPDFDVQLKKLDITYQGLKKWLPDSLAIPDFDHLGNVVAQGHITGDLSDLKLEQFLLNTSSVTKAKGDFRFKQLTNLDDFTFEAKQVEVSSLDSDLQPFIKDSLPDLVSNLEAFSFLGDIAGSLTEYKVNGQLTAAPGVLQAKADINFNTSYSSADYQGSVGLEQFNVGELLGDTSTFGQITLDVQLSGSGLALADVKTKIEGEIKSFDFNDYTYKDFEINGSLKNFNFLGAFNISDPNITLDFEGLANLDPENLSGDLALNIDTVDFKALNFMTKPLALSTAIRGKFTGADIDQILGTITLNDMILTDGIHSYRDSLVTIISKEVEEGKELKLTSQILDLNILGDYKILDLPSVIKLYFNDYFPIDDYLTESDQAVLVEINENAQQFNFNMNIKDVENISTLLLSEKLEVGKFSAISGRVDTEKRMLDMDLQLLEVAYQGNTMDSVLLVLDGKEAALNSSLQIVHLKNDGLANFSQAELLATFKESKAVFELDIADGDVNLFSWSGRANTVDDVYNFIFGQDLVISDTPWKVNAGNSLTLSSDLLELKNFTIENNQQMLTIGMKQAVSNDKLNANVQFENIQLAEFSDILNNPDLAFGGILNGEAVLEDLSKDLKINSSVNISALSLNETNLGTFTGNITQANSSAPVGIDLKLTGANEASVLGTYQLDDQQIDLEADLDNLSLVILEPFLSDLIQDSEGGVRGKLSVKGSARKPDINGQIFTKDLSTKLVLTGARYFSNEGNIEINNRAIELNNFELKDKEGDRATLVGKIDHNYFENFNLDLKLETDRFKILNTTREDNSLYNGIVYTKANVLISGPIELININAQAETLTGTKLEVQPLYDDLTVSQESYIIFGNPNDLNTKDSVKLEQYSIGSTGFNLALDLKVTDDAEMNIVIDPLTGDQLNGKGTGDLYIQMNPLGRVDILGVFTMTKGVYNFSYEKLVKRKFIIDPSSSLTFVGDPLSTVFDIKALYTTKVSVLPLIENESDLSENQRQIGKRRTESSVVMKIVGDLEAPEFGFDLEINEPPTGLEDLVTSKLVALRDDQSGMNKQVFGLLLINNYISEGASTTSLADSGSDIIFNSISTLINNQLGKLADKHLSGVNLEVGFDSYNSEGTNISELQLGLSKQLFNDRVTIKVGGDINLTNETSSNDITDGYSAFAGNYVLEYKLNESGKFLLRVFHQSDYEALLQTNTNKTGFGIRYHKSY